VPNSDADNAASWLSLQQYESAPTANIRTDPGTPRRTLSAYPTSPVGRSHNSDGAGALTTCARYARRRGALSAVR